MLIKKTVIVSSVLASSAIITFMTVNKPPHDTSVKPTDDKLITLEKTEYTDPSTNQKVVEEHPVYSTSPTPPAPETQTQVSEQPFDSHDYVYKKLLSIAPTDDPEAFAKWHETCTNTLVESLLSWDSPKEDFDSLFTSLEKYATPCNALNVFKASGKI